jgi:hypothetical protein
VAGFIEPQKYTRGASSHDFLGLKQLGCIILWIEESLSLDAHDWTFGQLLVSVPRLVLR